MVAAQYAVGREGIGEPECDGPGAAEQCMLAGVDAYVPKPFTKDTLLTLVARYVTPQ